MKKCRLCGKFGHLIDRTTKFCLGEKRDIFINDPSSGTCHYYCVLNDELTADIIYNSCFNFDAVLYQIGDPTQNGYYNFIKIYSIKAKNSLFKGIPEHA